MRRLAFAVSCLAALAAAQARAQDKPISVMVAGGVTTPLGDAKEAMGKGWNVGAGVGVAIAQGVGVRADYLYSRFGARTGDFDVTLGPMLPAFVEVPVRSKSQMHIVSVDATWTRPLAGGARAYVLAGPSVFRRRVQLTGTGPQGQVTACEPQWLQCQAQAIGFDRFLGVKKSDDLGFNLGAGIALPVGLTALLTVEARYFHVIGPKYNQPGGGAVRASASFVPITVGLKF